MSLFTFCSSLFHITKSITSRNMNLDKTWHIAVCLRHFLKPIRCTCVFHLIPAFLHPESLFSSSPSLLLSGTGIQTKDIPVCHRHYLKPVWCSVLCFPPYIPAFLFLTVSFITKSITRRNRTSGCPRHYLFKPVSCSVLCFSPYTGLRLCSSFFPSSSPSLLLAGTGIQTYWDTGIPVIFPDTTWNQSDV